MHGEAIAPPGCSTQNRIAAETNARDVSHWTGRPALSVWSETDEIEIVKYPGSSQRGFSLIEVMVTVIRFFYGARAGGVARFFR